MPGIVAETVMWGTHRKTGEHVKKSIMRWGGQWMNITANEKNICVDR